MQHKSWLCISRMTKPCNTTQYRNIMPYNTIQYHTIPYMIPCNTISYQATPIAVASQRLCIPRMTWHTPGRRAERNSSDGVLSLFLDTRICRNRGWGVLWLMQAKTKTKTKTKTLKHGDLQEQRFWDVLRLTQAKDLVRTLWEGSAIRFLKIVGASATPLISFLKFRTIQQLWNFFFLFRSQDFIFVSLSKRRNPCVRLL